MNFRASEVDWVDQVLIDEYNFRNETLNDFQEENIVFETEFMKVKRMDCRANVVDGMDQRLKDGDNVKNKSVNELVFETRGEDMTVLY